MPPVHPYTVSRRPIAGVVLLLLCLSPVALPARADIQQVPGGFLISGSNTAVMVSETNGALVSINAGAGTIARSGSDGLWALAFTNSALHTQGMIRASSFVAGSASNSFTWSLSPDTHALHLVYSNTEVSVVVTLSNRSDGVDMTASVTSHVHTLLGMQIPAELRFEPSALDRFIAPSHSSDGVGAAYTTNFFIIQPEEDPASWKDHLAGPSGYISLYGGGLNFIDTNDPVSVQFTADGTAWLGEDLTNAWSTIDAVVNRPPAAGQTDIVLLDSSLGPYVSGSRLGGDTNHAGWLMRISGPVDRSRAPFSLDVVTAAIEHLADTVTGRTEVALLSMERGPVIGFNWPSSVRVDEWRTRLNASTSLASHGVSIVDITSLPDMMSALNGTNTLAVVNPYGEIVPATLAGGVAETVSNIQTFVHGGGSWFETGGHPFFFALQAEQYYTNSLYYPPAFADFLHLETTHGNASLYGVQPVPEDPWAGATNPASLFVPGQLAWGGDAEGGYWERGFATYVTAGNTWQSPVVRLSLGQTATNAISDYGAANGYNRTLDDKMSPGILDTFRESVMIHYVGVSTQLMARMHLLPPTSLLHFEQYLYGGFDKQYPDHLPPNPSFGTPEDFTNFLGMAKAAGHLTMPYTNPTFWGEDPRGPTFLAKGTDPLVLNPDGSFSYEEYFGEGGYTATPWHPDVRDANEDIISQFLTHYPVDLVFQDQIGARTWQYDLNPASPTPVAYIAGNAARAGEDSASIPVSTENGWDRLVNAEAQFCGMSWGLAPTINAPVWRRFLRERYAPETWNVFPLAQIIAHDKVAMYHGNLNQPVTDFETASWTLGLGYGMSYYLVAEDLLMWIDRLQASVCARYIGEPTGAFHHRWGSQTPEPDNGVMEATYGPVDIVANLAPEALVTNGITIAPHGFLADAPDMRAAVLIPPGASTSEAYVVETTASGFDFWVYSRGDRQASLTLPTGYNGHVTLSLDGAPPVHTQIIDNLLAVPLGTAPTTNAYLWAGSVSTNLLPSITGVTPSTTNVFGTASITLSGTVRAPGPTYPSDGETVRISFNGVTNSALISGGAGGFSVTIPTDTLPIGFYTITYAYGGNAFLNAAPDNTETSITVVEAPPPVYGPILVDFGSDASFNGVSVVNPDADGYYWNSIWAGAFAANLVSATNGSTTVDIGFDGTSGTDNVGGPDGAVDQAALGLLGGDTNAVNDYYVTSQFQIQGLSTGRTYRLTFFGSRSDTTDAATEFAVCTDAAYTGVLASVLLNVRDPLNPSQPNSNTVAALDGLVPRPGGILYVSFRGDNGGDGYLNAMMIEDEGAGPLSPDVLINAAGLDAEGIGFSFVGSNSVIYLMQYTTNLADGTAWRDVTTNGYPATAAGDGSTVLMLRDTNDTDRGRSYRLILAP